MKVWMLGSGSKGNAILVECQGARTLIDCGFGTRTLAGRFKAIGVAPRSISACLVTHEHGDHASGAAAAAKRWGWALYATAGTLRGSGRSFAGTRVQRLKPGHTLELEGMSVLVAPTLHDANESVGFVVTSRSTGARAGLFYDFGRVTRAIAEACKALDILVLESNHDDHMLRNGPYPRWLQARIACPTGHLSNRDAGVFARDAVSRQLNHLVLAHLSENCNTPRLALTSMRGALARSRFKGTLTAAKQDAVVGPFTPKSPRAEEPDQYVLL